MRCGKLNGTSIPPLAGAVGASAASLKYLAPYVFKVAIANPANGGTLSRWRIEPSPFATKNPKAPGGEPWPWMPWSSSGVSCSPAAAGLPTGFMKVWYFGFINPNCKVGFDTISALIELSYGFNLPELEADVLDPWQPIMCPHCGGTLKLRAIVLSNGTVMRPG